MRFSYIINENDFLVFQLYTASKSDRINKKKRNGWLFLTISILIGTAYFYQKQNILMTIYLGSASIVCATLYPKYFKWRYKKHYRDYIKENYSKRFRESETIEFTDTKILTEDKTGEGAINLSEITSITEIKDHFFINISTGISLIIPKDGVKEQDELLNIFEKMDIPLHNDLNWKW